MGGAGFRVLAGCPGGKHLHPDSPASSTFRTFLARSPFVKGFSRIPAPHLALATRLQ